jgi:hypothetical protein
MSDIEFETVDSPNWPLVKEGANGIARDRLQNRYDAVYQGAQWFRDDADTLVKATIKKPPEHLSAFSAIADSLLAVCTLVVPEAGLAAEIFEAVKTSYESLKPAAELYAQITEQAAVSSVEDATSRLQELTKQFAEDVADKALQVKKTAEEAVPRALDAYITHNPQPLKQGDTELYKSLCDAIGIKEEDLSDIKMEVWNKVFPPFKAKVLEASAQLHFEDMDNDGERLKFLLDEGVKGTDPYALLHTVAGKVEDFDKYLKIFQSGGSSEEAETHALGAYYSDHVF